MNGSGWEQSAVFAASIDSMALLRSEVKKVSQEIGAFFGEKAFGMELDTVNGILAVPEPHDLEGLAGIFDPRGDFEAFRDGFARNDQAVVAGSLEGIWETFEDALTCM